MQNLGTIDNTYTILEIKDNGLFSITYLARHNQTNVNYLIEVFRPNIPDNLINILNNFNEVNNPYIIKYISNGSGPILLNNKPQENLPYIVYENITHSTLFSYVRGGEHGFSERRAKLIFKKILNGVNAIHHANICHRDLKLENILLDENYNPKITGFYISTINNTNLRGVMGTLNYMAPEIFSDKPYNGIISDIFNLGQILFNLVTKMFGFKRPDEKDKYYNNIILKQYDEFWNSELLANLNLSQSFKNLYMKMVAYEPSERPTVGQILNDEWMQEINNLNEEQINDLENEVRQEFQQRENNINN